MLLNILSIKKAKQIFSNNKFYGFYVLMDKFIKEIKFFHTYISFIILLRYKVFHNSVNSEKNNKLLRLKSTIKA